MQRENSSILGESEEKEMEEKEKDIDMILELLGKATKEKVADILVFIKYYLME